MLWVFSWIWCKCKENRLISFAAGAVLDRQRSIIKKSLKALKKQPAQLFFPLLANLYRQAGQLKIAERIGRHGVKQHPQSCRGWGVLGHIYFDQGLYKKAGEMFEKVLDLEPSHLLALRFLGKIYIQLKDLKQALRVYKTFSLFYPDQDSVQEILKKLTAIAEERYQNFSSLSLEQAAQDLDHKEFLQRPCIYPLSKAQNSHTMPEEDVLAQMSRPPLPRRKFPQTAQGGKEVKIERLKHLMDRLSEKPSSF